MSYDLHTQCEPDTEIAYFVDSDKQQATKKSIVLVMIIDLFQINSMTL